jgi:hypothetical protein
MIDQIQQSPLVPLYRHRYNMLWHTRLDCRCTYVLWYFCVQNLTKNSLQKGLKLIKKVVIENGLIICYCIFILWNFYIREIKCNNQVPCRLHQELFVCIIHVHHKSWISGLIKIRSCEMDCKQEKLQMVTTFCPLDLLCIKQNIVPYQNTVCDQ